MASLEHRTLTTKTTRELREFFPYVHSRPQELVNYALKALAFDLIAVAIAILLANALAGARLFDAALLPVGAVVSLSVLLVWFGASIMMPVPSEEKPQLLQDELRRTLIVVAIVSGILLIVSYLENVPVPHSFVLFASVFMMLFVVGWRLLVTATFAPLKIRSPKRVLIAGDGEMSQQFADRLTDDTDSGATVWGFLAERTSDHLNGYPILGTPTDDLQTIVRQHEIDDVVVVIPDQRDETFNKLFEELQMLPVNLHIILEHQDLALPRGENMLVLKVPGIGGIDMRQRMIKRLFDILVAGAALLAVLPVLVAVAVAIKIDSPEGDIFFRQWRVGERCHRFRMLKFRSMVPNAEKLQVNINKVDENGNLITKIEDDPRITRVGKFIRKYSIDELPQLINVLLGDMSLVGPRPEMPWIVNGYESWQFQRFAVPQGITGWWQVNGRSEKQMHLCTAEDLYYIKNYSLLLDMEIMFKTISVVFTGKGAF